MFPINNILFCPLCKKRSERWISSGCAFQIKGHENYTYYKESCTKCQKHFYLPCGSNGIIEMRSGSKRMISSEYISPYDELWSIF